jgi:hypothetical protein
MLDEPAAARQGADDIYIYIRALEAVMNST